MWEFLSNHPWWGLIYLIIICITATFISISISMGIGAAIGSRKASYLSPTPKSNGDVVH